VSQAALIGLLFGGTFGLAALRVPIAFAMGLASALVLFLLQVPLSVVYVKMTSTVDSWPFLAIPFFLLAGNLMTAGGITARLVRLADVLVGWISGGLSQVVVVVEMLLSGMTGSEIGDAAALGSVLVPAMRRSGYAANYAATIVAASATMGPIIPPSIAFVIYAAINDLSIGRLFLAGIVPGVLMGLLLMIMQYVLARRHHWPRGPFPTRQEAMRSFLGALPALFMPVLIIGGILGGVFTATEAGALVAAYAMAAAFFYYKNVTWREMLKLIYESALLTAAVIFLLAVASVYQFLMGMLGVPRMLGALLGPLASTPWLFLVAVSLIVILFGMVLEGLPAAVVLVPVVFPIAKEVGIHPVHFNIVLTAAVGIGLFLPPIGVGLLMALRFANIAVGQHFKAYWPYLLALLAGLLLLIVFPGLTLFLPRWAAAIK
jgi:C4-dicarboxylate transporter, DctM subunit